MNLDDLHKQLIAAARTTAPNERVPYAFEKRIMARLLPGVRVDAWATWSHALWRAAVSCVAVVMLCGAWALWSQQQPANPDFSQEFESAVVASASPDEV
jgi:anti-sigma-K factor RskA